MKIAIADIQIGEGRRPVDDAAVVKLMDSIKEVGLINAVTVNTDYRLIAGAHRLEACKRLGWTEIDAEVKDLDDLRAELAEIDENLIRNELHYLDYDNLMLRRKEIYEALHPETIARNLPGHVSNYKSSTAETATEESALPFNADVAQKVGTPERTLRKSIQRARDITPEAQEEIRKVGLGKEKAVEVARAPAEQQVEKVRELVAPAPQRKNPYADVIYSIKSKEAEDNATLTADDNAGMLAVQVATFSESLRRYTSGIYDITGLSETSKNKITEAICEMETSVTLIKKIL